MASFTDAKGVPGSVMSRVIADHQQLAKNEAEDLLRDLSHAWADRRGQWWQRDYSSPEAYERSVKINRQNWLAALGDPNAQPLPAPVGDVEREPFLADDDLVAEWISVPVSGHMQARALLARPKGAFDRLPLVLAQHGLHSSPEKIFGFDDSGGAYHAYGRHLVRAGYAVLAPRNVSGGGPRGRLQRMCLMLGMTLSGLEIYKLRKLLDHVLSLDYIDAERVAMWGLSMGGAYTLFTTPVEPRIKSAICTGFFNDRLRKMIIDDPRYSCFLSASGEQEHIFIPRWLVEFDDADVASLICPRPLQIQAGKADGIAWWPYVVETFARTKEHYEKLGIADRIELHMHNGGHEICVEAGIGFLQRWS